MNHRCIEANLNTRLMFGLVVDVVNALRATPWSHTEEDIVLGDLAHLPSGMDDLGIMFSINKRGDIDVLAGRHDQGWVGKQTHWHIAACEVGRQDRASVMMNFGRMERAFYNFWDNYHHRCSRAETTRPRSGIPVLGNARFFSQLCCNAWMADSMVTFFVGVGQVSVGTAQYRTHRAWRKDVRAILNKERAT